MSEELTSEQRQYADRAIEQLRLFATHKDVEVAHSLADDALCVLLRKLGFGDVVDEFDKLRKWYA